MAAQHAAVWLIIFAGALGWLFDWLADDTTRYATPDVSTICPQCNQCVRPVIIIDATAEEDGPDWLDVAAGVRCPHCHYRFGDVNPDDIPGPNHR